MPKTRAVGFAGALLAFFTAFLTTAQAALPTGFQRTLVVNYPFAGDPIGFAQLPDGRFFIIDRTGTVRLAPVGGSAILILTIPNVVFAGNEQGLLGIAVDPDWPARPYLYFYYNHTGLNCYLTMYTASGDLSNPLSSNITLGTPFHVLTDLPDANDFHQAGTLRFAPDGTLVVSTGDDGNPCGAQDISLYNGKLLRLDIALMPQGGSGPPPRTDLIPTGNPFSGPGVTEQLVYAWGMRNPFRFTIDPLTSDIVIGDVGFNTQEEVDFLPWLTPGLNYGWPQREGLAVQTCCGTCGNQNQFTDPIYAYVHDVLPKAVIAGPLYRHNPSAPRAFPASYDGSIFVEEFYDGWIRRFVNNGSGWQLAPPVAGQPDATNWATGLGLHSDIQQLADGAIYMVKSFGADRGIYRIEPLAGLDAGPVQVAPTSRLLVEPSPLRSGESTRIRWSAERAVPVALTVQDVSGRVVRTLLDRELRSAIDLTWDGRAGNGKALTSGIYFLRLESAGAELSSTKVVVLR
jgi:glucose/arabinose dehydrogenase